MIRKRHWRACVFFVLLAVAVPGLAVADPFTPEEQNLDAAILAATMGGSQLKDEFGMSPLGDVLSMSGSYTASTWSLLLSGSVNGAAISINYTGAYNSGTGAGTFTTLGTAGGDTWDDDGAGDGVYTIATLDATHHETTWDQAAGRRPRPPRPKLSRHVIRRTNNGDGTDTIQYTKDINGVYGSHVFTSTVDSYNFGRRTAVSTLGEFLTEDGVYTTATSNYNLGTFSGTVTLVPEPGSISLMGLATVPLLVARRRR